MPTILVADDDGHIREVVRYALEKDGHKVVEAADGSQALTRLRQQTVDLVVLDIVMPETDGLEVCRQIRSSDQVPIVFLTSRDEEIDRVLGLELGADDYVVKPFSPRELTARVKAVLRRSQAKPEPDPQAKGPIKAGALIMDQARHRCLWNDQQVDLSVTEFALLASLARRPGNVLTRDQLVDQAYGIGHVITDRTIDSHIRRIRQKLSKAGAPEPIETVYGLGYRLRDQAET